MKKISEIAEKQIVSIMGGSIIVTKLDELFLLVSKSGIKAEKSIPKELDFKGEPSDKDSLFTMISMIDISNTPFHDARQTLDLKDEINKRIVVHD